MNNKPAARNVAAFTDNAAFYPSYLSINHDTQNVSIVVRARAKVDPESGFEVPGDVAEIILSEDQFADLIADVIRKFRPKIVDPNQPELGL